MILRVMHFLFSFVLQFHFSYSDPTVRCHEKVLEQVVKNSSVAHSEDSYIYHHFQREEFSVYNRNSIINFIFNEHHTSYDKVFWVVLTAFILFVMYIRAKIQFRNDYPDESGSSFIYAIGSFRKMIAPDPYLDPEMKKETLMSTFNNGPLIAFWILWYSVGFFSLDEVFGVTYKHIEDPTVLIVALSTYFINIVGCCIIYDTCVSSPMKYYKES